MRTGCGHLKTEEKIEDILGDDLPTVEERRLYREQVKEDKPTRPTRETGVKFEEKEEVKTITTKKMRDEELRQVYDLKILI